MLVKYWMKKDVVTVDADSSMNKAISLMKTERPILLPVLKKGKLVGVLTDGDLKKASASEATALEVHELAYLLSRIKVSDIMTPTVITVPPDFTLEEAAAQLLIHDISGMPVVDDGGEIVGVISQREIFLALITLSGFGKKGMQLALEVEDRPGSIKEVTDVIRSYGGRLVSILTSYEKAAPGQRRLYVRAWAVEREKLPQMEADLRSKAPLLYVVDHKEGTRREFIQSDQAA
jgi:acetoin utilization protein AcuB